MKPETLEEARRIDDIYFGNRNLQQILNVLFSQVDSLRREQTLVNAQNQVGDILFALVSVARNQNWDLDQLLRDTNIKIKNRRANRHYYEAHITIEPVFEKDLEKFKEICKEFDFHVAELLMKKRKKDTGKRSTNDSFCTGRSISYSDIEMRMLELIEKLKKLSFKVWRYKIESTLLDSRYDDSKFPLVRSDLPSKESDPRSPAEGALSGKK